MHTFDDIEIGDWYITFLLPRLCSISNIQDGEPRGGGGGGGDSYVHRNVFLNENNEYSGEKPKKKSRQPKIDRILYEIEVKEVQSYRVNKAG